MYLRIPWELVADAFGSAKHTLDSTCLYDVSQPSSCLLENTTNFSYQGQILYMGEI
jgi:hypothetical protein